MSFTTQLLRGLRATLVLWLLTVVVITLPLLGLGRLVAPDAAAGSLLLRGDAVVGSRLIGQPFSSAAYLQGRPAGDPNTAQADPALPARVAEAARRWRDAGVAQPPADLLLDSGSRVDPQISLASARLQLPRLARERGLPLGTLEQLLQRHRQGPLRLQAIEPVVNVLAFNLELDVLAPQPRGSAS